MCIRDSPKAGRAAAPQSSSPPPGRDAGSPSRAGGARPGPLDMGAAEMKVEDGAAADGDEALDEMGGGIDLARGFQPIGSYHSNMTNATA
ncbi:MAG: hypothetical protein M1832_001359 [Thelocarpon impressellum]|nr:MAG: hypothetical protein M1832_001359 [Thelocarpon impressellum]